MIKKNIFIFFPFYIQHPERLSSIYMHNSLWLIQFSSIQLQRFPSAKIFEIWFNISYDLDFLFTIDALLRFQYFFRLIFASLAFFVVYVWCWRGIIFFFWNFKKLSRNFWGCFLNFSDHNFLAEIPMAIR